MKKKQLNKFSLLLCALFFTFQMNAQIVESWQTSTNKSKLFQKQTDGLFAAGTGSNSIKITIDPAIEYQTVEGFGWTMTQGSAYMIMQLSEANQTALLKDLFSVEDGMGSATVRVALGASDLGQGAYTYQDDQSKAFSLEGPDLTYLIPVLQKIVQINPNVKFMASPWSAPAWMKTAFSGAGKQQLRGGSLKKEHFGTYADYILKYFQEMEKLGLKFHSMTIQNEPLTEHNWPSMYMSKEDQYDFVENYLGPKLANNGYGYINLIGYDHNCDNTEYPIYVARSQYIEGSAFHLYGGDISALTTVYNSTKKSVYFTEQWTGGNGSFSDDFSFHMRQIMLGTVNNMGKVALAWNVASDQNWDPHTDDGGCDLCMGAVTIHNSTKAITKNVTYYTTAQMSKVTKDGSVRIGSSGTNASGLVFAAFQNPDNFTSLVVFNTDGSSKTFDIVWQGQSHAYTLSGNTVASLMWAPMTIEHPVTGVTIDPTSKTIDKFDTFQLTATVAPENATLKSVRWSSSDSNIASVDATGLVRGRNAGTVTITATTVNEEKKASCSVTVNNNLSGAGEFPEIYNLIAVNSNKGLDVKDGNRNAGGGVQQWEISNDNQYGGNNQRWLLEYAGGDTYYIQSKFSELFLTAGAASDGAKITQEEFTGNTSQEWEITLVEDGIYKVISASAERAMDVSGPSTSNGAEVHLWTYGGGSNQHWKFVEVEKRPTTIINNPGYNTFNVYPNPTTGLLYLNFENVSERTISLYTISGSLLFSMPVSSLENTIDISSLNDGMYIMQIQDGENSSFTKILKRAV